MAEEKTVIDLERVDPNLSEGVHQVLIEKGEEKAGGSGFPYWNYQCRCTDADEENKAIWIIVSLAPAARWKLDQFLNAVGAPETGKANIQSFIGKKLRVSVVHEEYEGIPKAKVDSYIPAGSTAESAAPTGLPGAKSKGVPKSAASGGEAPF